MILYIISWSIIYFILIFILHYLFLYFQKNLTTTKTKDYYNFPQNEYYKINDILNTSVKKPEPNIVIEKVELIPNNIQCNPSETIQSIENTKIGTTMIEKYCDFNIDSFNSQFENKQPINENKNNMKSELEQYLNKINK
jgi:hypothetical protein